ncbi:MAG TPA: hypothetical protein ENI07_25045 [Desulfobacterales bacterium]|nr:hypothetical protein [Desulfobacterales bacterium]
MEWWYFLRALWAISALIILLTAFFIIWRVKGIFSWKRSLKEELKELKSFAEQNGLQVKKGVKIIEDTCGEVFKSFSPDIEELRELPLYIRTIASCFYPNSDCPELQISIGSFLRSLEKSLNQFDLILRRPGFKKLKSINIRKIRDIRRWYLRLSGSVLYRWVSVHKKMIQQMARFRLFLFLDPFSWLVYLSRYLTTLVLIKYLMADLYIFIGRLAIEAYSDTDTSIQNQGEKELEKTLEELDALENDDEPKGDPQIQEVRNQLVGFSSMAISNPNIKKWRSAVHKAAEIISKKHFPDSDFSLEEAALGPLLESARAWAGKVSKGREHPLIRRLYRARLGTIYRAKNLSDNFISKSLQNIIKKSYKTYGWLKWPSKVFRMAKKVTPLKISLAIGWEVSKKASLAYIHGKTFDMACEELDRVYRLSRSASRQR